MKAVIKLVTFSLGACVFSFGCAGAGKVSPTIERTASNSNNHVILVGHGAPASDYPKDRLREFFRMHSHDHSAGSHDPAHAAQHEQAKLREQEIREWPRTPENDPYKFGIDRLARALQDQAGHKVLVAYNEFCAPSIQQAVDQAVSEGAERIILVTTMMTPGGGHSERDIPAAVAQAKETHLSVDIVYAWPFDVEIIGELLARQVRLFEAANVADGSRAGRSLTQAEGEAR